MEELDYELIYYPEGGCDLDRLDELERTDEVIWLNNEEIIDESIL